MCFSQRGLGQAVKCVCSSVCVHTDPCSGAAGKNFPSPLDSMGYGLLCFSQVHSTPVSKRIYLKCKVFQNL